jgi:hypothetical protein
MSPGSGSLGELEPYGSMTSVPLRGTGVGRSAERQADAYERLHARDAPGLSTDLVTGDAGRC